MTSEVSEILKKALALPPEARAAVAGSLLESLNDAPADEGVEAAWSEEIKRCIEEIRKRRAAQVLGAYSHVSQNRRDMGHPISRISPNQVRGRIDAGVRRVAVGGGINVSVGIAVRIRCSGSACMLNRDISLPSVSSNDFNLKCRLIFGKNH
jgi:hypothetical protein